MHTIKRMTAFIIFAVFFSACNYFRTEPVSTPQADPVATAEKADPAAPDKPAENNAGLCENKYYPLKTETGRAYKITGSVPANYVLTQKKTGGDSFSENRKFASGTDVTTNWVCTDDGLRNVQYNSGVDFSTGNFKMETLESSGLTFPKTWETGKKWKAEYKISGKLKAGPVKADANGTVTIDNEITALDEKVTTAAGEFEAAKVVSTINMNLNVGRPMKITMTNWYAPGAGLVKQEASSPFGGKQTVEYTGDAKPE